MIDGFADNETWYCHATSNTHLDKLPSCLQIKWKQESIPVTCQPPASKSFVIHGLDGHDCIKIQVTILLLETLTTTEKYTCHSTRSLRSQSLPVVCLWVPAPDPHSTATDVSNLGVTDPSFHFPPNYGHSMNSLTWCDPGSFPAFFLVLLHGSHLLRKERICTPHVHTTSKDVPFFVAINL